MRHSRSQDAEFCFSEIEIVLLDGETAQALSFELPVLHLGRLIQEDGKDGVLAMSMAR